MFGFSLFGFPAHLTGPAHSIAIQGMMRDLKVKQISHH